MSGQISPNDETSPLLGHQRAESCKTLVGSENPRKTDEEGGHRKNVAWILAAVWSAVFLGALDGTIVATLLSPIGAHFRQSNQSSYIGTAYLLSVCCFTPLYGRLSDIIGRRAAMLLALSLFGLGTLLCGVAPSMDILIIARAIAGIGGGGVMTVQSIVVTDLIPLKKRGVYQGIASVVWSAGAGLGGPLGGWLNDQFGWRAAFLFQVPILALSIVLVSVNVDIPPPEEIRPLTFQTKVKRIDFLGSLTLVPTVGCLLLGLSLKSMEDLPWSHPLIWGLISASCVCGVVFAVVEARIAQYPIMPGRLMKQRTPMAIGLSVFFASIGTYSMIYNVPLYLSTVRLSSSTDAGFHLLPYSISVSCGSLFTGWIIRGTGKLYTLTLVSASLGMISSVSVALWDSKTPGFRFWLDLIPCGFGVSSMITSTLIAIVSNVTREDMAVATGITFLFRTTGQVLGVSLSGALLQAVLTTQLRKRITGPNAFKMIERIKHSTAIIPELPTQLRVAAVASYADALRVVFMSQVLWYGMAFVCCLAIKEKPLPATMREQAKFCRDQQNEHNQSSEGNESGAT